MHICLCHAYAAAAPASPSPLPAPPLPRRARERRQKQEELDRMRKLGDAGEDVDDVMTWVSRSRQSQQKKAAEAEAAKRRAAEAAARRRDSDQEDDDEDEVRDPGCGGTGYGRLACMAHVGGHPAQCLGDPLRVRFHSKVDWTADRRVSVRNSGGLLVPRLDRCDAATIGWPPLAPRPGCPPAWPALQSCARPQLAAGPPACCRTTTCPARLSWRAPR